MLDLLWPLTRPVLFAMDAERAHEWTIDLLAAAPRLLGVIAATTCGRPDPSLARNVAGVEWAGPVGLAAGLDKDGRAIPFWPSLGFGSVEVGTVTAHAQPGNPRPRLHRIVRDRALINAMGFNNRGSEDLAARLRHLRESGWVPVPVGVNVGKSKVTPAEDAPDDYATSVKRLAGLADWITVNVSSPNTPGLRDLQDAEPLKRILGAVLEAATAPVLLKLSPDLSDEALGEAVAVAVSCGVAGIIATNTTLGRSDLTEDPHLTGGMSGAPLWRLARSRIAVAIQAAGKVPVVGVGGVSTVDQVRELLDLGCAGIQLYTGLIFEGPGLPARLHRGLAANP